MSSSAAGKFQDHYIILGVETNADSETIQAAYARLASKFHELGDHEKLATINQAFEVLADPALRAAFDQVKGVDHEAGNPKFTGQECFDALQKSALLRAAVLCILYDRMRVKSFKPSLSMRNLEGMLRVTGEGLNFALWYLKKRSFVINDDKSALAITVEGMDFLEQNPPEASAVMEFIKPDALLNPLPAPVVKPDVSAPPPTPQSPPARARVPEIKIPEPVMNVLNRAIQRNQTEEEPIPRVTLSF